MSIATKAKLEQNLTKPELTHAIALLLELNPAAEKEVGTLSKDTLEQIFISYKNNALRANQYLEEQVESARKHALTTR